MHWKIQGLIPDTGTRLIFSPKCTYCLWGYPVSNSVGTEVISVDVKLLGHKTDHSSPYSAEVKNEKNYTSVSYMPSWQIQGQLYLAPSSLTFPTMLALNLYVHHHQQNNYT
jgi:hypothetical protein